MLSWKTAVPLIVEAATLVPVIAVSLLIRVLIAVATTISITELEFLFAGSCDARDSGAGPVAKIALAFILLSLWNVSALSVIVVRFAGRRA